jgi:type II secretory pathway predicted ATPase ExeA
MALSAAQKRDLLARDIPRSAEVRRRLIDYMARTGMRPEDLRARTGYSGVSIRSFINGKYEKVASTCRAICDAMVKFMDTYPIGPQVTAQAGRLYETQDVVMIRQHFYDALDYQRCYYLRGAPGTQKSYASEHFVSELNRNEIAKNGHGARAYYIYCPELVRPNALMKLIAEAVGSITMGENQRLLRNIRFELRDRKVVLLFDEAQHLDVHCLETIRELHDRDPHCGMLFLGSHELEKTFSRLDMEQWRSRMHHGADLPGISKDEARDIVRGELGEDSALQKVEFPKGSGKKMTREDALIASAMSVDLHKGREVTYLNARTLFRSINGILQDRATKKRAEL